MDSVKRKGARSMKDIPLGILEQLNRGEIETANLVEWLAVDQQFLLKHLLQEQGRLDYLHPVLAAVHALKKQTINTVNETIGSTLFEQAMQQHDFSFLKILTAHQSDVVRCWATYTVGRNKQLTINEMLQQIQVFAADKHFGVREISWMAVRSTIAANLDESIAVLTPWTGHSDENIRRFATEATRPRGVWCAHIDILKENPSLALPLLEPLKADPAKYVQDSVGNWLNDASKTAPGFVRALCQAWEVESDCKETRYIIKKALRTLDKR